MRKEYISPEVKHLAFDEMLMAAQSVLDPDKDNQSITPTDDEWDGEFSANHNNVWDDEL